MARTTEEIKRTMTTAWMANDALRQVYGWNEGDTFESRFPPLSIESLLLFVVAGLAHTLEVLMDAFRNDVETRITQSQVQGVAWYHTQALAYQHGHPLMLDEHTWQPGYAKADPSARIVRYVAVRDIGTSLQILVAGDKNGKPHPLEVEQLESFRTYMNRIKMAGIMLSVRTAPPDDITPHLRVQIDNLVLTQSGESISQAGKYPVREAIETYLAGIKYGGAMNKTRLVDAVQAVPGVLDVELQQVKVRPHSATAELQVTTNNYTASGGSFTATGLDKSISYYVV